MADTEVLEVTEESTSENTNINYDNYTLMPKSAGNKNKKLGITNVRMGSGAPVCNIELNEIQELMQQQINCYDAVIRNLFSIKAGTDVVFVGDKSVQIDQSNGKCVLKTQMFACINEKMFELKPSFYVPTTLSDGNAYAIFTYNDMVGAISGQDENGNNSYTSLYEYGYKGSFSSYTNYTNNAGLLNDESIATISADSYLYNINLETQEAIVNGAPYGTETSKRCGFTYAIISSSEALEARDNEIVIKIGTISNGVIMFGGTNVVITSSLKNDLAYHIHKDTQRTLSKSNWVASENTYVQSVTVSMLLDYNSKRPIISLIPTGSTIEKKIAEQDSYTCISEVTVNEETLTFICYENKPSTDLKINIKVV